MKHPEHEIFISRLSPACAEKAKHKPQDTIHELGKGLTAFCYFCEEQKFRSYTEWTDHIMMHTGERNYICNNHLTPNKKVGYNHTSSCKNHTKKLFDYDFVNGLLSAFMCTTCNYVQIRKENIRKHLVNSHDYSDASLEKYYQKIDLISIEMCPPKVKEENSERNVSDDSTEEDASSHVDEQLQRTNSPMVLYSVNVKQEPDSCNVVENNSLDESSESLNQSGYERLVNGNRSCDMNATLITSNEGKLNDLLQLHAC